MMQHSLWSFVLAVSVVSSVVAQQPVNPSPFQPVPAGSPITFEPFPMVDPTTGKPVTPETVLVFPDGTKVTAKEFYASLNALERYLNTLGYSLKKSRHVHVPSKRMYDPQDLARQQAAFASQVYPDDVPTPGPEDSLFNPAGGFNLPWSWDSDWLGNWYIGARAQVQTGLSGDIAPVNFRAYAEGKGMVRLWGQEREVVRGVADARLEPTSPTNLRFTASIEAYINGQRRWGWPENGPFTHDFTTGVSEEFSGARALELWNFNPAPVRFEFWAWVIRVTGELGARGSAYLDYRYSAGLNAINNSPAIEAGITPRVDLSGYGNARAEASIWVAGVWAELRAQINVATWRLPTVAGVQVGQENGRYYAERYIRSRSEAQNVLRGSVTWAAGLWAFLWSWSTGGELFNWPGFNHEGWLINWSGRHYFN